MKRDDTRKKKFVLLIGPSPYKDGGAGPEDETKYLDRSAGCII